MRSHRSRGVERGLVGRAPGLGRKPPSVPSTRKSPGRLVRIGGRLVMGLPAEGDAVRASIIHIHLQVQEASVARVEDAQAIARASTVAFGIDRAVGEHRVAEHLGDHRGWAGRTEGPVPAGLPRDVVVVRVPQVAGPGWGRARSDRGWRCRAPTKILSWMTMGISRPPSSTKSGRPWLRRSASKLSRMM